MHVCWQWKVVLSSLISIFLPLDPLDGVEEPDRYLFQLVSVC